MNIPLWTQYGFIGASKEDYAIRATYLNGTGLPSVLIAIIIEYGTSWWISWPSLNPEMRKRDVCRAMSDFDSIESFADNQWQYNASLMCRVGESGRYFDRLSNGKWYLRARNVDYEFHKICKCRARGCFNHVDILYEPELPEDAIGKYAIPPDGSWDRRTVIYHELPGTQGRMEFDSDVF